MLSHGANIGAHFKDGITALTMAAQTGHWDVMKLLLSRKSDQNKSGALQCAVKNGQPDAVALLLSYGAEVNTKAKGSGNTALITAAVIGHCKVLSILLSHKADINAGNCQHYYLVMLT